MNPQEVWIIILQDSIIYITDLSRKNNTLTIIATHNTKFITKLDVCFRIERRKIN